MHLARNCKNANVISKINIKEKVDLGSDNEACSSIADEV